jgi:hypothetical protein
MTRSRSKQVNSFAAAKALYSEACRAFLRSDPAAVEKVTTALERLRAAEQPPAPAHDDGKSLRVGVRARFRVIR